MQSNDLLASAIARVTRRLLPFLLLMYVLAFLDRANIGFARQAFQLDTGISDAMFAFGAGVFFLGYALFEVPSNLILHRVGARAWMCRIMVTWGLVSAGMALVQTETAFYWMRFLLGVAEAGFFPGVILYLTYWFPAAARARAMGLFYFGAPIAFIVGGPVSGLLLELEGGGLHGWQWMFLVEGLAASAVGVWAFWRLDNGPANARWLSQAEKQALQQALDDDARQRLLRHQRAPQGVWATLRNARVLYLCLVYFLIQMSVYGVVFYLPGQVAALVGQRIGWQVGLVTAIPWLCAALAVYLVPRHCDRHGGHRPVAALLLALAAVGMAGSVLAISPLWALPALCLAAAGFIAVQPLFWTFPTAYLGGTAAAGGIGLINALGSLGGFVAPVIKTWADHGAARAHMGLYLLATTTLVGALLLLGLRAVGLDRDPDHNARS